MTLQSMKSVNSGGARGSCTTTLLGLSAFLYCAACQQRTVKKRTNPEIAVSVLGFQSELAERAARRGIDLPCAMRTGTRPAGSGDLTDMYERTDPARRRARGQFFTPPDIAEFMVRFGIGGSRTVLDPACGLGVFLKKAVDAGKGVKRVYGIDADGTMVNACHVDLAMHGRSSSRKVELHHKNYICDDVSDVPRVDFLVCNPPYLNFHDFDREMASAVEEKCGVRFSRLANLYALFMVKAAESVKKGGKIAFITPSEFLYTGYGRALKKFLLDNFTIISFVTFDFDKTVFDTALTTSTISLFVNKKAPKGHRVAFVKTRGSLAGLDGTGACRRNGVLINRVRQDELDPDSRWQRYYSDAALPELAEKLVPLAQQADVKRGIATGSNAFFTLSSSEVRRWRIEGDFLVPVISKAVQVGGYKLTKSAMRILDRAGHKIHLLYCASKPSANLYRYIKHGEKTKVDERYLCAHRSPWYSMEKRVPAPILATVFSRNNMRFIRNAARCLNLAAYHGIYPRFSGADMTDAFLCYLNSSLCAQMQKTARREYGGGLHKFEPRDLLDLPVVPVTQLGRSSVAELAAAFRRLSEPGSKNGRAQREADQKVREITESL